MSDYIISEFDESLFNSYQIFVQRNFGKNAYQGKIEYLNWLYFKNPYGRGYSDFLVALDLNNNVIGCLHKIRYEIRSNDKKDSLACASIHNLMIDLNHRNGVGFLLLRELLKKEKSFLIPGVIGKLSDSYRSLGSTPLKSFWGFKLFKPNLINFTKLLFGHKLNMDKSDFLTKKYLSNGVKLENIFTNELLKIVNKNSYDLIITKEYLQWRLFDDVNKSTLVLWSNNKKSVLLITLGKRRGIPVARIFFSAIDNLVDGGILLKNTFRLLGSLGYPLTLITSTDSNFFTLAKSQKIRDKSPTPDSYFYSKLITLNNVDSWPLISDLGFEERFTKE
jgi:hypothetical protein